MAEDSPSAVPGDYVPTPAELLHAAERSETPAQALDRNWTELLQELRVAQTGVQILFAFLLVLPFQPRFAALPPVVVGLYLFAVAMGLLATALLLGPVSAHRLLFRRHAKNVLVDVSHTMAGWGLVCLTLCMSSVITVVLAITSGLLPGILAGLACLLVFALLWVVIPLQIRRRSPLDLPYTHPLPLGRPLRTEQP